jgi:hypothetical protein
MRVHDTLVRSGYFWRAGKEDQKASGTLTISDGGKVSLEILGSFSGPTGTLEDIHDETMMIGRVVGQIEKEGPVTLEHCHYLKRSFAFGGVTKSQVKATWAVVGVSFAPEDEISFDEYYVSIEGLEEWLRLSGTSLEFDEVPHAFILRYQRPNPVTLYQGAGFSLSAGFGYTMPSMTNIKETSITQQAWLKIATNELKEPVFFRRIAAQVREFLCFALDSTVSVSEARASNSSITEDVGGGESRAAKMHLYYGSINHLPDPPRIDHLRMLFRYPDIGADTQVIIARWFELYQVVSPAINLYFSARAGAHKFLDGRFLSLAQAVETLHRRTSMETAMEPTEFNELRKALIAAAPGGHKAWVEQKLTFANEISLANRLKRLLEPFKDRFGDKGHRKRLVRAIVDTRNYLTHYDSDSAEKAATGTKLWVLCEKMEALLQLHLLTTMTFSDEQISAICNGPQALKKKLALELGE